MNEPKVYVGTYKKYNEGSIYGKWLTLTDYTNYDEFISVCKKVHADEKDPELMIQDSEYMPDGLSVMESISREEYDDIIKAYKEEQEQEEKNNNCQIIDYSAKAIAVIGNTIPIKEELKKLGGRFNFRLSCGAGWIFPKTSLAEVQKLINAEVIANDDQPTNVDLYKSTLKEYLETSKYPYPKDLIGAVKIGNGYILLTKGYIETKFCFADEGEDYNNYLKLTSDEKLMADYFLAENLRKLDNKIDMLLGGDVYIDKKPKIWLQLSFTTRNWVNGRYIEENARLMTTEEKQTLLSALQWQKEQFNKRLQTYLKRYGVSKLHTWTYWRDA